MPKPQNIGRYFEVHVLPPAHPKKGEAQMRFVGAREYPTHSIMDDDLQSDLEERRAAGLKGFFIRAEDKKAAKSCLDQIPHSLQTLDSFYIL